MPHGLYKNNIKIEIIPSHVDAQIRFTTDGSIPLATSEIYTKPLTISSTTILRAVEIENGAISAPTTASYIYYSSILNQSNTPEGYPLKWGLLNNPENFSSFIGGYAPADYEMDPEMTNDPYLREKILDGMNEIPVLSIVTDKNNLFCHDFDEEKGGIYIYTGTYEGTGNGEGRGWTRPVSIELFGFSSTVIDNPLSYNLTIDCGIRLHGGSSRVSDKSPKHSFRLVFKKEYGEGKLTYPLWGTKEPTGYDQLVLRCHFGTSWQHWRKECRVLSQYTRDTWIRRMYRKMGHLSVNALYVHVFINGMYWGIYNIAERIDEQFCKIHLGVKNSYDVIKIEETGGNHVEASEGSLEKWNTMLEMVKKSSDVHCYYQLQGLNDKGENDPNIEKLLDIDAFIDYMLINQMSGNMDWGHHNWYAIRRKGKQSEGFQFICWDSENIFGELSDNNLSFDYKDGPTEIFNELLGNQEFTDRYFARARKVLSPEGILGYNSVIEVWDSLYYTIKSSLYAESARWGDYRRDVHQYGSIGDLYTVDGSYQKERIRLLNEYFPYRSQYALDLISDYIKKKTGKEYLAIERNMTRYKKDESIFNLRGTKIRNSSYKGVYIKNRKAYISR